MDNSSDDCKNKSGPRPSNDGVTNLVDKATATEKSSVSARNAIEEEIHGVRCLAIQESEELVHGALSDFREELETGAHASNDLKRTYYKILAKRRMAEAELHRAGYYSETNVTNTWNDKKVSNNNSSSVGSIHDESPKITRKLEKAITYCRNHYAIDDPNFRLRFLRAELFDVKRAVIRYFNYLNVVHELWGAIALEREVRVSDFNRSESKLLRKGHIQILPFRDRSGRRIVTLLGGMSEDVDPIAWAKSIFYVWDASTRDSPESQKVGSILITDGSCWKDENRENSKLIKNLVTSVPTRIVAIHTRWRSFFNEAVLNLGPRLKIQAGDDLEMKHNLKSFGIPIHLLARTRAGSIKLNHHSAWLNTRKILEQPGSGIYTYKTEDENVHKANIVDCPLTNDIIFRQGTPYWDNPGNSIFRDLILGYWEKKQALDEKDILSEQHQQASTKTESDRHLYFRDWVIEEILTRRKGRFLQWNKDLKSFSVMTNNFQIQKKVAISIYNCRKKSFSSPLLQRCSVDREPNIALPEKEISLPKDCLSAPLSCFPNKVLSVSVIERSEMHDGSNNSITEKKRSHCNINCNKKTQISLPGAMPGLFAPSQAECCFHYTEEAAAHTNTSGRKRPRIDAKGQIDNPH